MNKNAPDTIRVPLQSKTTSGKTMFTEMARKSPQNIEKGKVYYLAYMRRSTTKQEQAESLPQQEEGIKLIAEEIGVNMNDIYCYEESKSGFENRSRGEWARMLNDMDRVWAGGGICILLCRDSSRLSRNPTDNVAITDRLFGDNKFKKRPCIQKIYMLGENVDILEWSNKTDKSAISTELHDNYINSLVTRKKSITGIILKLQNGEFPYEAPHGLERVIPTGELYSKQKHKGAKTSLRESVSMKFIRRAFEMKVEGKTSKEISAYLKKYAGIYITPKKIVETIISNTVYKGEYTEKTTGKEFRNLKFQSGKPPVDMLLWDRANATIGKRGNGIGEGQVHHLFVGRIKTEQGGTLQVYISKGKSGKGFYRHYKGTWKTKKGETINVYISETNILQYLSKEINIVVGKIFQKVNTTEMWEKIMEEYDAMKNANATYGDYPFYSDDDCERHLEDTIQKNNTTIKNSTTDSKNSIKIISELFTLNKENIDSTVSENIPFEEKNLQELDSIRVLNDFGEDTGEYLNRRIALRDEILHTAIKDSPFFQRLQDELELQKKGIEQLKKQKQELDEELKGVEAKAFSLGYTKEFADRQCLGIQQKLSGLEETIQQLSENNNLQNILDKLPDILARVVEHASKAISKGESEGYREDMKLVLEMIGVELQVNDKKELKLKLFQGLEDLLDNENGDWSHLWDTNPGPFPYHGNALPTELRRQIL